MLCGVFGKENLHDDACSKWTKTYHPALYKRIERSVNHYLHRAKQGMGKHEWIEEQSRTKDVTLGHVYAQLQREGYTMHKHVKKCVRNHCMDWMSNPYTEYDTQCAVHIQRWYRHMHSCRVMDRAREALRSARNRTCLRTAMDNWTTVLSATCIIQRAFRAHAAKRELQRMTCQWMAMQFVRNVVHYYTPGNQARIVTCQRTCRSWINRHHEYQSEYVCI